MGDLPLAQQVGRQRAGLEGADRVGEMARDRRSLGVLVGVAAAGRLGLEARLDAVADPGEDGGQSEMGVGVGARQPYLQMQSAAVPDHPHRTGPVVPAPGEAGRSERVLGEPLVGVHVGRPQRGRLRQYLQQAGDRLLAQLGQTGLIPVGAEYWLVVSVQRHVQVHTAANAGGRGRHERRCQPVVLGHRPHRVLEQHVLLAGQPRFPVGEGHLHLADGPFEFHGLDGQSGSCEDLSQASAEGGDGGRLVEGVVAVVPRRGSKPPPTGGSGLADGALVEDELGLDPDCRAQAEPGEAGELLGQQGGRCDRVRPAGLDRLGEHHGGAR